MFCTASKSIAFLFCGSPSSPRQSANSWQGLRSLFIQGNMSGCRLPDSSRSFRHRPREPIRPAPTLRCVRPGTPPRARQACLSCLPRWSRETASTPRTSGETVDHQAQTPHRRRQLAPVSACEVARSFRRQSAERVLQQRRQASQTRRVASSDESPRQHRESNGCWGSPDCAPGSNPG